MPRLTSMFSVFLQNIPFLSHCWFSAENTMHFCFVAKTGIKYEMFPK